MFTHVMVGANDIEKSRKFSTAALGAIGYEAQQYGDHTFFTDGNMGFGVGRLANGGACEGEPGVRENAPGKSYGACLRDPDGNKICAYAPNPNAAV